MNTHTDPAHAALLTRLFELNGDIDELIRSQNLRPPAFLAFAKDPLVLETLAALEDFQVRHQRILARQHQTAAAEFLNQCTAHAHTTIETRRAATALARLTATILAPPRPTSGQPRDQTVALAHHSANLRTNTLVPTTHIYTTPNHPAIKFPRLAQTPAGAGCHYPPLPRTRPIPSAPPARATGHKAPPPPRSAPPQARTAQSPLSSDRSG